MYKRQLKEGIRTTLVQAGLNPEWWPEASRAFTAYKNATDKLTGTNKTPYEARHGYSYTGPLIPCGAAIRYLPHGPLAEKQHTFASKTRVGIFLYPELVSEYLY